MTTADLAESSRTLLVVPVGSIEQHGAHLPLGTDSFVAVELARRLVNRRNDAVLAPPIAYGSSGEHAGFAGTLSIGQEALELLLVELGRSASASFAGMVLVVGHGGNAQPVARSASRLVREGRAVYRFAPSFPGDAHAGRTETSLLLALRADLVRVGRAEAGETAPLSSLIGDLRSKGVRGVSKNGVLGDPAGASAEEGEALLGMATEALVEGVEVWAGALPGLRR